MRIEDSLRFVICWLTGLHAYNPSEPHPCIMTVRTRSPLVGLDTGPVKVLGEPLEHT